MAKSSPATDNPPSEQPIFGKPKKPAKTPSAPTPGQLTPAGQPISPTSDTPVAISQPMSPKTKKALILGIIITAVVAVAVAAIVVIVIIITHIDYKTSYEKAEEVSSALSSIQSDSSCYYVKNNAYSAYYSEKEYNKLVEKCRTSGEEISPLVEELGSTDAVRKNTEIGEKYDKFKSAFDKTYLADNVSSKLELYQAFHDFSLAEDDLDYFGGNTEAELKDVANHLINSGNDTLKEYGETWLKLRKTVESTYKAYYDSDWTADNHTALYDAYSDAYDAYYDFVLREEIDWDEIAELDTDLSTTQSAFDRLYSAIQDEYKN